MSAIWLTAVATAACRPTVVIDSTNERSSFSVVTGQVSSRPSEEAAVPKSSSASLTPSSRNATSASIDSWSSSTAVSVTSMLSRSAGSPNSSSACATSWTKVPERSCRPATFTPMLSCSACGNSFRQTAA